MNKNILKNRKAILSAALVIAATASAFAQGNGIAGINEATSMVSSYFDPGTKLIYAIGAVVGLATPTPARQPPRGSARASS